MEPSETVASGLETKEGILQYIKEHPGSHLRQIKRGLSLSMGVVQYHLYGLEKERKILSRRGGLYKRFYPALVFTEHQQEVLDVLSQETERDLLVYLLHNESATPKQLSEYAQISPGTINWHMKRLLASSLIRVRHEGHFVKYEVRGEKEDMLKLVRSYHPTIWSSWADRLANAITEVSSSANEDNQKLEPQRGMEKEEE
jgi:predicted transcriptional regulator